MSFVDKLYKRGVKYLDNLTRDPKAEAEERQRIKLLKEAQEKASKILAAEKTLLHKARITQSPGRPEEAIRYSIFPEDAKDIQTFLDNVTTTVNEAETGEEVDDIVKSSFNDGYENYKNNSVFNGAVLPTATGARVGMWLVLRAIKQLINDNEDLSAKELSLLKTVQEDIKTLLDNVKYKNVKEWEPIVVEDLKNLDTYKKILQTPADKLDKSSDEYKIIISLAPKIYPAAMKLLKNHGEVDFQDKEGDAFTGNVTEETKKIKAIKIDRVNDNFDIGSLILKTLSYMLSVLFFLMTFLLLSLGASMAVNLNVHKPLAYKILYAFYGYLFGLVVLVYVCGYRWWWLGKKPEYYGFLPLIPRFFVNPTVQFLLGWMTYKPNESISSLKEWMHPHT